MFDYEFELDADPSIDHNSDSPTGISTISPNLVLI